MQTSIEIKLEESVPAKTEQELVAIPPEDRTEEEKVLLKTLRYNRYSRAERSSALELVKRLEQAGPVSEEKDKPAAPVDPTTLARSYSTPELAGKLSSIVQLVAPMKWTNGVGERRVVDVALAINSKGPVDKAALACVKAKAAPLHEAVLAYCRGNGTIEAVLNVLTHAAATMKVARQLKRKWDTKAIKDTVPLTDGPSPAPMNLDPGALLQDIMYNENSDAGLCYRNPDRMHTGVSKKEASHDAMRKFYKLLETAVKGPEHLKAYFESHEGLRDSVNLTKAKNEIMKKAHWAVKKRLYKTQPMHLSMLSQVVSSRSFKRWLRFDQHPDSRCAVGFNVMGAGANIFTEYVQNNVEGLRIIFCGDDQFWIVTFYASHPDGGVLKKDGGSYNPLLALSWAEDGTTPDDVVKTQFLAAPDWNHFSSSQDKFEWLPLLRKEISLEMADEPLALKQLAAVLTAQWWSAPSTFRGQLMWQSDHIGADGHGMTTDFNNRISRRLGARIEQDFSVKFSDHLFTRNFHVATDIDTGKRRQVYSQPKDFKNHNAWVSVSGPAYIRSFISDVATNAAGLGLTFKEGTTGVYALPRDVPFDTSPMSPFLGFHFKPYLHPLGADGHPTFCTIAVYAMPERSLASLVNPPVMPKEFSYKKRAGLQMMRALGIALVNAFDDRVYAATKQFFDTLLDEGVYPEMPDDDEDMPDELTSFKGVKKFPTQNRLRSYFFPPEFKKVAEPKAAEPAEPGVKPLTMPDYNPYSSLVDDAAFGELVQEFPPQHLPVPPPEPQTRAEKKARRELVFDGALPRASEYGAQNVDVSAEKILKAKLAKQRRLAKQNARQSQAGRIDAMYSRYLANARGGAVTKEEFAAQIETMNEDDYYDMLTLDEQKRLEDEHQFMADVDWQDDRNKEWEEAPPDDVEMPEVHAGRKRRSELNGDHGEYTGTDGVKKLRSGREVPVQPPVPRSAGLGRDCDQEDVARTVAAYISIRETCITNVPGCYCSSVMLALDARAECIKQKLARPSTILLLAADFMLAMTESNARERSQLNGVNGEATNSDDVDIVELPPAKGGGGKGRKKKNSQKKPNRGRGGQKNERPRAPPQRRKQPDLSENGIMVKRDPFSAMRDQRMASIQRKLSGSKYERLRKTGRHVGTRYEGDDCFNDVEMYDLGLAVPELHLPVKVPDDLLAETALNTMEYEVDVPLIQDSVVTTDYYAGIVVQDSMTSRYRLLSAVASGVFTWASATGIPSGDQGYFTTNANAVRQVSSAQHFLDNTPNLYRNGETAALRIVQVGGTPYSGSAAVPGTWTALTATEGVDPVPNAAEGGNMRRLTYLPARMATQGYISPTNASLLTNCSQTFVWKGANPGGTNFRCRFYDNWEDEIYEDLQNVNNTSVDGGDIGALSGSFGRVADWLLRIGSTVKGLQDFMADQRIQYLMNFMQWAGGKLWSSGGSAGLMAPLRQALLGAHVALSSGSLNMDETKSLIAFVDILSKRTDVRRFAEAHELCWLLETNDPEEEKVFDQHSAAESWDSGTEAFAGAISAPRAPPTQTELARRGPPRRAPAT